VAREIFKDKLMVSMNLNTISLRPKDPEKPLLPSLV